MSSSEIPVRPIREVLAPFGALRPQPSSDWKGPDGLHPSLARFYAEVGPDEVIVPTAGNPFQIVPLARLWDMQAGYRWDGRSGERITEWHEEWLVVADQGGDPFVLDTTTGTILHARHGEGVWAPEPIFADIFVMALVMGTIGIVYEEAGEDLYDEDFEVLPVWRAALRARLAPVLGATEADATASRFAW